MMDLAYLFTVSNVFKGYIGICVLIAIYWIGLCAYHDIFKGPDHKFGYNYNSSLAWILLVFFAVPFLNIITMLAFIYLSIRNALKRPKEKIKNAKSV